MPLDSAAFDLTILDWVVFYLFWIVAAFRTKRTEKRENLAGALGYRIPAVVAFWLLTGARLLGPPFATRVIPKGALIAWLAMASSVAGLATCLWARVTLGRNWSSVVVVKQEHELIQAGPYRFVRHPIYTGMIALFLANVLLSGRLGGVLGLVCLLISFYLKLLREERFMLEQFPTQYRDYCRRVKRLIPFVH